MSLMLVMVTMRICTATSSVVNIIAVSQSQHYLVFSVLLIFCLCFSNTVFTGFHQHLFLFRGYQIEEFDSQNPSECTRKYRLCRKKSLIWEFLNCDIPEQYAN